MFREEPTPAHLALKWKVARHAFGKGPAVEPTETAPPELVQLMNWPRVKNWNQKLLAYLPEWQEGSEPQVTLMDLYMGLFADKLSARAQRDNIVHLQAALLQPEEPLPDEDEPSIVVQEGKFLWGSPEQLHSLVIPEQHTLGPVPPEGDREKCREVSCYLNVEATDRILVEGIPATTFSLSDKVQFKSGPYTFTLTFELVEGSGDFVGHIARGNRPSQLALKGENRFRAYDWHIFLRTLRRTDPCRIQIHVSYT